MGEKSVEARDKTLGVAIVITNINSFSFIKSLEFEVLVYRFYGIYHEQYCKLVNPAIHFPASANAIP